MGLLSHWIDYFGKLLDMPHNSTSEIERQVGRKRRSKQKKEKKNTHTEKSISVWTSACPPVSLAIHLIQCWLSKENVSLHDATLVYHIWKADICFPPTSYRQTPEHRATEVRNLKPQDGCINTLWCLLGNSVQPQRWTRRARDRNGWVWGQLGRGELDALLESIHDSRKITYI